VFLQLFSTLLIGVSMHVALGRGTASYRRDTCDVNGATVGTSSITCHARIASAWGLVVAVI